MNKTGGPLLLNSINGSRYYFGNKKQFSVGRSQEASLDIASKLVSRQQCIIKLIEDEWEISDLSTFKTTRVNALPLEGDWQGLQNGDKITISNYPDGEFIFYKESSMSPEAKRRKMLSSVIEIDDNNISSEIMALRAENIRLQQKLEEGKQLSDEYKLLKEKYEQVCIVLGETQKSLEIEVKTKAALNCQLFEEQEVKNKLILEVQNYVELIKECEEELKRVINEKKALEDTLSNEMDNTQSCPLVNSEISRLKEDLERASTELLSKDAHINELLGEKDILSTTIYDLLEQEYSCTVCSEILFQATTLQCRHTFCAKCVATWKLKKKECPVCRTKIKSEVVPLVIDSFIDKLIDIIGGDLKKRRDEIKRERASKSNGPQGTVSPYRYPQQARRGRNRSSRGTLRSHYLRPENILVALQQE